MRYIKINDSIYKDRGLGWIKMTNIVDGEDRRAEFSKEEINKHFYPKQKARQEVNEYWNNKYSKWKYKGIVYDNSQSEIAGCYTKVSHYTNTPYSVWYLMPEVREKAIHTFTTKWKSADGKERKFEESYYLVWHQGNLYWMTPGHYLPQCILYKFESIDKEPGEFIKWSHVRNLKLVWDKNNHKYA